MAESSLTGSPRSKADKFLLTGMKILLGLFVVGMFIAGHGDTYWPIVTWPMYDTYAAGKPPTDGKRSSWQLYVTSSTGQVYKFWEQDLYGPLPSGDGRKAVESAFKAKGSKQRAAFRVLLDRVQTLLPGVDIARIQYWQLNWWHVNAYQTPPFDASRPDEQRILGSFRVADLEAQS